jgi:biopolymer transport protein ExbD
MAIHTPGIRDRHNKNSKPRSRNIVGVLSLTAMVDMFTVLTVFLLQNYNVTGQVINIPKEIQLPRANEVKELKPAHIVTITPDFILLDDVKVSPTPDVKEQKEWMVPSLRDSYSQALKKDKDKRQSSFSNTIQQAVRTAKSPNAPDEDNMGKVTLQADKAIDFLTIKKIMATLTEAGADEINFAVIKKDVKKEGT